MATVCVGSVDYAQFRGNDCRVEVVAAMVVVVEVVVVARRRVEDTRES